MMKKIMTTLLLSSIALVACPMEGKCNKKDKTTCTEKCKTECEKNKGTKTCPNKDGGEKKENCNYHQSKPIQK